MLSINLLALSFSKSYFLSSLIELILDFFLEESGDFNCLTLGLRDRFLRALERVDLPLLERRSLGVRFGLQNAIGKLSFLLRLLRSLFCSFSRLLSSI